MSIKSFDYKGYQLICTATPLVAGGFSAGLFIGSEEGREHVERLIPLVRAPTFASEAEAIEHAKMNGEHWVDNHG